MSNDTKTMETPAPLASFYKSGGANLDIVAKATALRPMIRSFAKQGDDDRQATKEVMEKLHEEGLLHVSMPKKFGGLGGNSLTLIDTLAEISRGDGGHGWAAALLNICTWFTTLYSEKAQEEIFGENPRARIAAVFNPAKKTEMVDGGIRITGDWWYGSGSGHADWIHLGCMLNEGTDHEELGLCLVRIDEVTIKDTWQVAGMRASGSNTIYAEDVFVPSHRITTFGQLLSEDYDREYSEEPNYWASFLPFGTVILAATQIGLARAAVDMTMETGANKAIAYTAYDKAKKSPVHQIKLAEAVTEIDMAYLLLARACCDIDAAALDKRKLDKTTRARIRMDTGAAAKLCREAINKLLSVNGAGSFALANHMQRVWRDSEVGSRHGFCLPEMASLIYGRELFGVDDWVQDV